MARQGHLTDKLSPPEFKDPPFRIAEEGWGEFDLSIVLTVMGKGGEHTIAHDLNFQSERYEADHKVVCVEERCESRRCMLT